jgi:hypothetical protein
LPIHHRDLERADDDRGTGYEKEELFAAVTEGVGRLLAVSRASDNGPSSC